MCPITTHNPVSLTLPNRTPVCTMMVHMTNSSIFLKPLTTTTTFANDIAYEQHTMNTVLPPAMICCAHDIATDMFIYILPHIRYPHCTTQRLVMLWSATTRKMGRKRRAASTQYIYNYAALKLVSVSRADAATAWPCDTTAFGDTGTSWTPCPRGTCSNSISVHITSRPV